jgi:hypothetical protein
MRPIGVFRDGQLISPDGELISSAPVTSRAVAVAAPVERIERVEREPPRRIVAPTPLDPVDEVAGLFGRIVNLAQQMNETDQRRVRDLSHAANAALSASTYLPKAEQARFNAAIRNSK